MFQKILVAVGFGDLSMHVCDQAIELARLTGGSCRLVHGIEPIAGGGDDPEAASFYEGLRARASERLAEMEARFREAELACEATVDIGRRWRVVVDAADAWGADVIVIGSRPTLEGGRAHLGSTSHQVFFAASCPVLVVRGEAGD